MADGLTKALTNNAFDKFVEQMNLKDVDDLLTERRQEEPSEDDLDCSSVM
jgi:hypothetical protein